MTEQDLQAANQLINTANAAAANYAIMSGKTDYRTMNYNKELMSIQHKYNIEDWQRQADYNSPTAAIARLRGAGLNPILHDLQGNATQMQGVSLGSAPNASDSANEAQSNFIAAMNANLSAQSVQIAKKNAETERINAETARQNADTEKFRAEVDAGLKTQQVLYQRALTAYQEWQNSKNDEKFAADMQKVFSEIRANESTVAVNDEQVKKIAQDIINSVKLTAVQVKNYTAQTAASYAAADLATMQARGQEIENQTNIMLQQWKVAEGIASFEKVSQTVKQIRQQIEKAKKEKKSIEAQTKLIEKQIKNANLSDKEKVYTSTIMQLSLVGAGAASRALEIYSSPQSSKAVRNTGWNVDENNPVVNVSR